MISGHPQIVAAVNRVMKSIVAAAFDLYNVLLHEGNLALSTMYRKLLQEGNLAMYRKLLQEGNLALSTMYYYMRATLLSVQCIGSYYMQEGNLAMYRKL